MYDRDDRHTLMAVITLDKPAMPDAARVLAKLGSLLGLASDGPEPRPGSFILPYAAGNGFMVAMCMEAPVPAQDLAWQIETAYWWPKARVTMDHHRAHILVSTSSDEAPLEAHIKLAFLVSAILDEVPATGVKWGPVIVSPDQFQNQLRSLESEKRLPLQLWLNIVVTTDGDGNAIVSTMGLEAFGLMEIECERVAKPAAEAYMLVYNLAQQLITSGTVLADGDTIGETAGGNKIHVRLARSFRDRLGQVCRLEFTELPLQLTAASGVADAQRTSKPAHRHAIPGAARSFGRRDTLKRGVSLK